MPTCTSACLETGRPTPTFASVASARRAAKRPWAPASPARVPRSALSERPPSGVTGPPTAHPLRTNRLPDLVPPEPSLPRHGAAPSSSSTRIDPCPLQSRGPQGRTTRCMPPRHQVWLELALAGRDGRRRPGCRSRALPVRLALGAHFGRAAVPGPARVSADAHLHAPRPPSRVLARRWRPGPRSKLTDCGFPGQPPAGDPEPYCEIPS